jgi:RNA polymerase sigma-70 factor (ECF subfamily)
MSQATEAEIREAYTRTIGPLYAYVSRRCSGERALAEDVVQETWLRAVDTWRRRGLPDSPIGWLTTVAHNLLVSHYRRRQPVQLDEQAVDAVLTAVNGGRAIEADDIGALVQWGLTRLPRPQAAVLEMFHFEQQPVAAIAERLRLSERAVEGRLRRARMKLRQHLERALARR